MNNLVNCACGSDNIKRLKPYGVESVQCQDCLVSLREKDWNRIMGADRWVSVEERLPGIDPECGMDSIRVLAFNGDYFIAKVDFNRRNQWYETAGFESIFNVTDWAPLPTLSKEV